MPPSSSELWSHHMMPSTVLVDCLLPNGIIIQLPCSRDATLGQIKAHLWREARKYPLFGKLLSPELYIFVSITQDAEKEEFYDEARRLCDLRLFQPTLKIIEPEGNKEEKMLNYEIGMAIGMSVNEFNENSDPEVRAFRRNILSICESSVKEREKMGPKSLAQYYHPPDIDADAEIPLHIDNKLKESKYKVIICVWIMLDLEAKQKTTVTVKYSDRPEDVVIEAIRKKTHQMQMSVEEQKQIIADHQDSYLLKVCGLKLYLIGSHQLYQYRYIRNCIIQGRMPQLVLIKKTDFENDLPKTAFLQPSFLRSGVNKARSDVGHQQPEQTHLLWDVNQPFKVKINSATFVNVREVGRIFVKTGIYLGTEPLCGATDTRQVDSSNPLWNEWLWYEIEIPDLPRCARLCLAICCCVARRRREVYTLAWGNINLFDFKNKLMSGKIRLNLWPVPQGLDELLNPLGCPIPNPNKDSPCLEIEFLDFGGPVMYPNVHDFIEHARMLRVCRNLYDEVPERLGDEKDEIKTLTEIVKRDVLAEISEQEKELLWRRRNDCLKKPDSLPKLLKAVKWNKKEDVAQLYALLRDWPGLSVAAALELLDCTYLDLRVREFSVTSLKERLSTDKLSQYLLQLVQSLKVEPYLDNALTRFLLERALGNKKIGHFLFWHLKSEVHHVNIKQRFSLILEAYCRGCGPYLKEVNRQVESLEKLTKITDAIKSEEDKDKYKAFCDYASQADFMDALQNYTSPLNCTVMLGPLLIEESRVKHSKKSPLSLCWTNPDPSAECQSDELRTHRIIFKNGDDLRQDMLTLQVISIMERIWQSEGLDLRMKPYGCLSTGKEVGMIEEVRNCKTVMQIQRTMGTMAAMQVDNTKLFKWLEQHNPGDQFECARETFIRSCAGYCVATFVLGIGDRHPDNIMVTNDGHVFHIDFGHFLDHRKKKFGIQRERVPFILTEDFLHVIAGDAKTPRRKTECLEFMNLCGDAYMKLRKHANLFITLFSMMMGCGIPELQSTDDIGYLRKTLAVDSTDEEALKYFQQQFDDAYGGAWTTRVDWFFHYLKNK